MQPNPYLKKLGFRETDRVVIFHSDDIGMCHGSVTAYQELVDFGLLSSASTMVPCPWFPATANYCRQQADNPKIDMGVHLTLTSEWDHMRWGPISTCDPSSGLIDDEGYLHRTAKAMQTGATEASLHAELKAQIERAVQAGIDITHIDSHMFAIFHPKILPIYFDLARAYKVPAFMLRDDGTKLRAQGV